MSRSGVPTVRPEKPADVASVRAVVAAAFGGERVPALLDDLRANPAWLGLSWVAETGDDVVGHVSVTRGWIDAPTRLVGVLVLSPLSVHPDRQRTGIGSALVRAVLDEVKRRPEPLVFLEGDPAYYRRLGFVAAGPLGFSPPSVRIPEQAFQVWPAGPAPVGVGGALVYPDVFWRHDAVGLRP